MRPEDQAACCLFEPEMWVALPETRVALRVASVNRELGYVRLQGPEGTITVPAADAAQGILLIAVTTAFFKPPA